MTEERILDFLDGNLSSNDEEELLHRLAVSPERRMLLKQHLQVRELTSSLARRQYMPVPQAITASLFTTLAANGYAGPKLPQPHKEALIASLEQHLDKSASSVTRTPLFIRKTFVMSASLLSFIAGAAMIYFLMANNRQETMNSFAPSNSPVAGTPSSAGMRSTADVKMADKTDKASKNFNSYKTHSTIEKPSVISENGQSVFPFITEIVPKSETLIATPVAQVHGSSQAVKNPFDIHSGKSSERSFWQRLTFSLRSGEGKAPGNTQALTGSLLEAKASYDINDWLIAKLSLGRFSPFEMEIVPASTKYNADGIPLLQLSPILQNRFVAGAEIGAKWQMFDAPFESSIGFLNDFQGNLIPRAGFFTTLALNDAMDMNLGLEALLYTHDIRSSAMSAIALQHASFIGHIQNSELTGFIGPSFELVWHL